MTSRTRVNSLSAWRETGHVSHSERLCHNARQRHDEFTETFGRKAKGALFAILAYETHSEAAAVSGDAEDSELLADDIFRGHSSLADPVFGIGRLCPVARTVE
jgi:hypothetical protein